MSKKRVTITTTRIIPQHNIGLFLGHLLRNGTPKSVVDSIAVNNEAVWRQQSAFEEVVTRYKVEDA